MMDERPPTPEAIADVLERAIELMNETGKHWTQGSFKRPLEDEMEYAYCAVGGIRQAAGVRDAAWDNTDLSEAAVAAVARAYLPVKKDYRNDEYERGTTNVVIDWNDSDSTDWKKVVLRFKRARTRVLARAKLGKSETRSI